MDASDRRPQLPALSYLDIGKVKREDSHDSRAPGPPQTLPAATAASPTAHYPPGPPPPYSHPPPPQHAANWVGAKPGGYTPPGSRRTSGDDHENIKQTTRQSLPSISEALGVDSQTSYSAPTSAPQAPPRHLSHLQSAAPLSPNLNESRSYGMDAAPSHTSYASQSGYQSSSLRQDSAHSHAISRPESTRSTYPAPTHDVRTPTHSSSQQTPRPQPASTYPHPTAQNEQPSSQTPGSMGPPSVPYGYTPYPPKYAQPSQAPTTGPVYQPSSYGPPSTATASWKSEGSSTRYGGDDRSTHSYGDFVKRHLDFFDLDGALNDIGHSSGVMTDFARRYAGRMHDTVRSGATLQTLPGLVELDDMISKSRMQSDSLMKIREVVVAQQAAYEQHAADQRHKAFTEPSQPPECQTDEDGKGGFAGSDTKKRRGRAAPPGRCHSCNRAETPEWRRGPDGARTLCNACGLHYAKLTRKQTGGNKNANVGSSNLRPKE